jgi:hypothetical protein
VALLTSGGDPILICFFYLRRLIAHTLVGLYVWRALTEVEALGFIRPSTLEIIASAISLTETDWFDVDILPEKREPAVFKGDSPKDDEVFLSKVDDTLKLKGFIEIFEPILESTLI